MGKLKDLKVAKEDRYPGCRILSQISNMDLQFWAIWVLMTDTQIHNLFLELHIIFIFLGPQYLSSRSKVYNTNMMIRLIHSLSA